MTDPSRIYLVADDDSGLVELQSSEFDSEDILQRRLAEHPELLATTLGEDQRWLLVTREHEVPDHDGGGGRWSLDHVYVDQDAVPTLVEVKRSTDTRIRREVIGQLLEYAANATEYWPKGQLRDTLDARLELEGGRSAADGKVRTLLGDEEADVDLYWQTVESNLRSGVVRLMVVADRIPKELQRLVEYLNERMPDAEVLAIEVQQYRGGDRVTLVPRLIGNTTAAIRTKSVAAIATYDQLLAAASPQTRELAQLLQRWADTNGYPTVPAKKSLAWHTPEGHYLVRLYPADASLEVNVARFRPDMDETATAIRSLLVEICRGQSLSRNILYPQAEYLVARWPEVVGEVLPMYVEAVLRKHASE